MKIEIIYPILLILGAVVGFALSYVFNNIRLASASKEAEKMSRRRG